jgi:hypothetical protein
MFLNGVKKLSAFLFRAGGSRFESRTGHQLTYTTSLLLSSHPYAFLFVAFRVRVLSYALLYLFMAFSTLLKRCVRVLKRVVFFTFVKI